LAGQFEKSSGYFSSTWHRDTITITMTGTDESGDPVSDSDWAVVIVLPLSGEAVAIPVKPLWLIFACSLAIGGTGLYAITRRRRRGHEVG
jgi:hypothetical protein